jgi:DNA-binding response OmpR family regulator
MAIELPPLRILIVDDDRAICDYMQTLLERDGYQVKTLSDPTRVVAELKARDYHLVILDLMMPKRDGIEVLRDIRKQDKDIAVVIFTGYPNLDTAVASMKLDVVDYIKKPFNVDEFRAVIARVMRRRGWRSRLKRSCGASWAATSGSRARSASSRSSSWLGARGSACRCSRRSSERKPRRRSRRSTRSPSAYKRASARCSAPTERRAEPGAACRRAEARGRV